MNLERLSDMLRTGGGAKAESYLSSFEHLLSPEQRLRWWVTLRYEQGNFLAAWRLLEQSLPLRTGTNARSDNLLICHSYRFRLELLIGSANPTALRTIEQFLSSVAERSALARGFGWETLARIIFVRIALQQLPSDKRADALAALERALAAYAENSKSYHYYKCRLFLLQQQYEYLPDDRKNAALESLDQALALRPRLAVLRCDLRLLAIQLKWIAWDDPRVKELPVRNRRLPYLAGQGRYFMLLAEHEFQHGRDGIHWLEKARFIFQRSGAVKDEQAALQALGLHNLHLSRIQNAVLAYREALRIAERSGDANAHLVILMGLAEVHHRMGAFGEAVNYYEQVEALSDSHFISPFAIINLANVYDQMNLTTKAIGMAKKALERFKTNRATAAHISLANFILGNLLMSDKQWLLAVAHWEQAVKYDSEHGDFKGRAEKIISLAFAVAQNCYAEKHFLTDEEVTNLSDYYDQALECLEKCPARQENIVTKGQVHQNFSNMLLLAKRYDECLHELDKALVLYRKHHLKMQAANTYAMKGLLALELGKTRDVKYWDQAVEIFTEALRFMEEEKMLTFSWRVNYYLATIETNRGLISADESSYACYVRAAAYLLSAHQTIDGMRKSFTHQDVVSTDEGKLGLISDKSKVYVMGILLSLHHLRRYGEAFYWLERLKSRSLIDNLNAQSENTITDLHPETDQPESLKYHWKEIQGLLS